MSTFKNEKNIEPFDGNDNPSWKLRIKDFFLKICNY